MGPRLKRLRALSISVASLTITMILFTTAGGKGMKPEEFFSGSLLEAYNSAQQGDTERIRELVRAGVDLNRPGKDQLTPLGLAVVTANRKAIVSLLHAGADPNLVIPDAGSPAVLAIARYSSPPRTEALEALLDAGYDPNQLLSFGKPYMFYFVDFSHWPGLKLALRRGGDINVHRDNGDSLLTYLMEGGDLVQARELIAMGADVAACGPRRETPLLAIESKIRKCDPSVRDIWRQLLEMRELILSKLPDPRDRRSAFTDIVEEKIRQNPSQ